VTPPSPSKDPQTHRHTHTDGKKGRKRVKEERDIKKGK
jgi:hypothetical protein